MSLSKLLKLISDNRVRSDFLRSIAPVLPRDFKCHNRSDILGGLAALSLVAGTVELMRLVLAF
jgi:hypothetical protein